MLCGSCLLHHGYPPCTEPGAAPSHPVVRPLQCTAPSGTLPDPYAEGGHALAVILLAAVMPEVTIAPHA